MKRNTCVRLCVVLATLCVAIVHPVTALGEVIAESTFSSGLEGWSIVTVDSVMLWSSHGGHPGGYLQLVETAHTGNASWAVAPAKFLGDWSALDGVGMVWADTNLISGAPAQNVWKFEIGGPGGYAVGRIAISDSIKGNWETHGLGISRSEWNVTDGTWEELLRDVQLLRIEIEHVVGNEMTGLDNVRLEIPDNGRVTRLTVSSSSGGEVISPGERQFEYTEPTTVKIEARPDPGHEFVGWVGTAVSAGRVANPSLALTTVFVDGDYSLEAIFHATTEDEVQVRNLVITGDQILRISDDRWQISGNAMVNGFLHVNGEVSANTATLKVSGNGRIWIEDVPVLGEVTLYEGPWEFDGQTAATTAINNFLSGLELAGMQVKCTYLGIIGTTVKVQGYIQLPDYAGGGRIDVTEDHYIQVSSERGLEYDLELQQSLDIKVAGIVFKSENSSIRLSNHDADHIAIFGTYTLDGLSPHLGQVTVNLDPDEDRYLQIKYEDGEIKTQLIGKITIARIVIVPEKVYGEDIEIDIDTVLDNYRGKGALYFPMGTTDVRLDCELGIMGGYFDSGSVVASFSDGICVLRGPGGVPVVYLMSLGGGVYNLSPVNSDPIIIKASSGFRGGPEFFGSSLITLELEGQVDLSGSVQGTAIVHILTLGEDDSLIDGKATVTVTAGQGVTLDASLEAALGGDPFLSIAGDGSLDTGGNVSGSFSGKLVYPRSWPFGSHLEGMEFPAECHLQSINDDDTSNDYVLGEIETEVDIPWLGRIRLTVGFKRLFVADEWDYWWDYERVGSQAGTFMAAGWNDISDDGRLATTSDAAEPQKAIFYARWETGTTDLYLTTPAGEIIAPGNVEAYPDISYYADASATEAFYVVRQPMPGAWEMVLSNADGVGEYSLEQFWTSAPPAIEIVEPALDTVGGPGVLTSWSDGDGDDDARISLYYDTDRQGADGALIVANLSEDDPADSYVWDTEGVPTGNYYVYAVISDEKHLPAISYSTGRVSIVPAHAPAPPRDLAVVPTQAGEILLTWTASGDPNVRSYNVSYTADAAGAAPGKVLKAAGNELRLANLTPGQTYRIVVAGVDGNDVAGLPSEPILVTPPASGNRAPMFAGGIPSQAFVGELYAFPVAAKDLDGDAITYSLATGDEASEEPPAGLTITADGLLRWMPRSNQLGRHAFTISLDDGHAAGASRQFTILVTDRSMGNRPPEVLSEAPPEATPGGLYTYPIVAWDPESGRRLSFALLEGPQDATVDVDGLVQWAAPQQSGRYEFVVRVADTSDLAALHRFTVQVDLDAPSLGQMPWGVLVARSAGTIQAKAEPASDATGPVQYQFLIDDGPSLWQESPVYEKQMLPPNTLHSVRVRARDASPALNESSWSESLSAHTLAAVPPAPLLVSNDLTTLTVRVEGGENPPTTELALYNNSAGHWVGPDGIPSEQPVWATAESWTATTVLGLEFDRTYQLQGKARNGDGIETEWSPVANLRTAAPVSAARIVVEAPVIREAVGDGPADEVTASATFSPDPYLNDDYLYVWEALENPETGQRLRLLSEATGSPIVTFAAPAASAHHPATYLIKCKIVGRQAGNSVTGTVPVQVVTSDAPLSGRALIGENAAKRVFVPTEPVDDTWKVDPYFGGSGWIEGAGGVGYEQETGYDPYFNIDVGQQMYGINTSCYIVIPFDVPVDGIPSATDLLLKVRYDDGFIAYLNGVEVARRNFVGEPAWNSAATVSRADSAAVNFGLMQITSPSVPLHVGRNMLAIQALNNSTTSSDLLLSVALICQ